MVSSYNETPICTGGQPVIEPTLCPTVLVPPVPQDLPLTLTLSGTVYGGVLKTDMPQRINRVSALLLQLWKRINYINFNFSTVFTYTFQYPTVEPLAEPKPDKTVTGSAFDFQAKMLAEIDYKLNTIVFEMSNIRPVASTTEHRQIIPGANHPQAAFLFGEWTPGNPRIASPKWQIMVPHFKPEDMDTFDNSFGYIKGSYQYLYVFNDNSRIIFYGNNPAEMDTILARWLTHVNPQVLPGSYLKKGEIKGLGFSVRQLRLIRIDYYSEGVLKSTPTAYIHFPRKPIELGI